MKQLLTSLILFGCLQLCGQVTVDFTDSATPTYGSNAQQVVTVGSNQIAMMWGGDANADGIVLAKEKVISVFPVLVSLPSDRDIVLNSGLGGNPESEMVGYHAEDINMDGIVLAKEKVISVFPTLVSIPSDRDIILNKVLLGNTEAEQQSSINP